MDLPRLRICDAQLIVLDHRACDISCLSLIEPLTQAIQWFQHRWQETLPCLCAGEEPDARKRLFWQFFKLYPRYRFAFVLQLQPALAYRDLFRKSQHQRPIAEEQQRTGIDSGAVHGPCEAIAYACRLHAQILLRVARNTDQTVGDALHEHVGKVHARSEANQYEPFVSIRAASSNTVASSWKPEHMKKLILVVALGSVAMTNTVLACSCVGNSSYCETLSPQWFTQPDATALVVKLTDYHYGITVKVVQVIGNGSLPDDTLTVWGDNGALCRIYLNAIAIGDTMIFGLNETDFMGNTIWNSQYPPDLEEPGHYMVSVCGVYALDFNNGLVSGYITGPTVESMTLAEFEATVTSCTEGVGIEEQEEGDPMIIRYDDGMPVIEMRVVPTGLTFRVFDVQGHVIRSTPWKGEPYRLQGLAAGAYLVEVIAGERRWSRRVVALQ